MGKARLDYFREDGSARCFFPCQDPKAPAGHECSVRCRPAGMAHRGDGPDWEFTGPPDAPTLTPSINCRADTCWHGFIRDGQMTNVAGDKL